MNNKHYLGKRAKSVTIGTKLPPISKIVLIGENENRYEAGNDSGYVMEIYVPTATQNMANDLYRQAKGFVYQGFTANGAFLPPTMELGDGITTHGVYGILASQEFSFTPKMSEDIGAPYVPDTDHEYQYMGTFEQDLSNKVQLGKLYYGTRISRKNGLEIVKTDGTIVKSRVILNSDLLVFYDDYGNKVFYYDPIARTFKLTHYINAEDAITGSQAFASLEFTDKQLQVQIQNTNGDVSVLQQTAADIQLQLKDTNGNISSLQQTATRLQSQIISANGNISSLQQTATKLQSQISSTNGELSSLEQKVDSFKLTVSNGYDTSTLTLKAGGVTLSSAKIDMSGVVTFNGLREGTTVINGGCIQTGFISSNRLNLTGSITFRDLSDDLQNDIDGAYDAAYEAQNLAEDVDYTIRGWTYRGTTEIDGAAIRTGTVTASTLEGGEIALINGRGDYAGILELSNAYTANFAIDLISYAALRLRASSGATYIQSGYGSDIDMREDIRMNTDLRVYGDVYSKGVALTSDLTKKKDITYNIDHYNDFFDLLRPIGYRFKDGTSGRIHLGLGAQDVEKALAQCGIPSKDFAGLVRSDNEGYAIRYEEFIPLLIKQVQILKTKMNDMERRIDNE